MSLSSFFHSGIDWLQLVGNAPMLLVLTAVGIVCLFRLSKRPRESWLLGIAAGLLLFKQVGLPRLYWLFFSLMASATGGTVVYDTTHIFTRLAFGLPYTIITAAAWGLIFYAAFGEGSGPRSKYLIEDEPSEQESA